MITTYVIPRKSKSFIITVELGYNATGLNAFLDVQLQSTAAVPPAGITLPLVVSSDGMSGTYRMTGSEIPTVGLYDGESRVTDGAGVLLYSKRAPGLIEFSATIAP